MPPMRCQDCGTTKGVKKVEDPHAADVYNTPGVMIKVCEECLQKIADGI